MTLDTKSIKVGDTVVFESAHVRCEAKVTELETVLGHLWLHIYNPEGFHSVPLRGCKKHSIPHERVLEHRPTILLPLSNHRTRTRPAR